MYDDDCSSDYDDKPKIVILWDLLKVSIFSHKNWSLFMADLAIERKHFLNILTLKLQQLCSVETTQTIWIDRDDSIDKPAANRQFGRFTIRARKPHKHQQWHKTGQTIQIKGERWPEHWHVNDYDKIYFLRNEEYQLPQLRASHVHRQSASESHKCRSQRRCFDPVRI